MISQIIQQIQSKMVDYDSVDNINKTVTFLELILYNYNITPKTQELDIYHGNVDEQVIKRFLATKMVQGRAPRTIEYYGSILNQMSKKSEKPLLELTGDDILVYLAIRQTQNQCTNTTLNNERRVLSSFYSWAMSSDLITKNPMNKVGSIKVEKKKKSALTEEELELIRNECVYKRGNNKGKVNYRYLALIEVLLSTGCRAFEVANIKIEDIKNDEITILGKGNKERIVYLNARARSAINNYLNIEHLKHTPYLFYGINGHGEVSDHLNKETVNDIVKKLGKQAGISHVHAHKFRRTAATLALRRGMPIELVSKMLGHESIDTTQIYLDINQNELKIAHQKYVV